MTFSPNSTAQSPDVGFASVTPDDAVRSTRVVPSNDGAGQQCCYDIDGFLMMTSDTMWGGNPHRAHNLGMRPFYEANKVG